MAKHSFQEVIDITRQAITEFEKVQQRPWGVEGTMIELAKQLGDLSKHVMVQENYYLPARSTDPNYITTTENIGDELADIFYCLVRLADYYKIDLEAAFMKARATELKSLAK